MTLEDQGAQDLAESNHGHEDFQSTSFRKRFPIFFEHLDVKHLQDPCWISLGYFRLFSVRAVTFWLHHVEPSLSLAMAPSHPHQSSAPHSCEATAPREGCLPPAYVLPNFQWPPSEVRKFFGGPIKPQPKLFLGFGQVDVSLASG